MPARRPRLCWPLLALCLLCACCYRTALRGEFLHDDVWAILNNPDVRPGAPIRSIFGNDFWGKGMGENSSHKSYRPLCTLSFRLNVMLAGMDPFYFHAVNVILHCVVTSMLMFTCDKAVFADRLPAFITALVFAVHPIHTEAVTGIVGRADVLACLLFLLTFLSYNRSVDHYHHGDNFPPTASPFFLLLSLLLGTSAMLVKETGITVFGVCLVYDLLVLCHRRLELQNGDVHPRITQHPGTFANSSGKENGKHRSTHKGAWNSCHSTSPGEQRGNSLPASCKAVSAILRYCSREGVINANIVT